MKSVHVLHSTYTVRVVSPAAIGDLPWQIDTDARTISVASCASGNQQRIADRTVEALEQARELEALRVLHAPIIYGSDFGRRQ